MHRFWLAHVERQCVATWRSLLTADDVRLGPEAGEHVWTVSAADDVTAKTLTASGLARFVMPVDAEFTVGDTFKEAVPGGVARMLAALADKSEAQGAWVFPLRRHGRFAAEKLQAWWDQRAAAPGAAGVDAPFLMVALGDDRGYAGVCSRREAFSPWPGGRPPRGSAGDDADAPSRAGAKLEEALAWTDLLGIGHAPFKRWLELGAFPGGMTAVLAALGKEVVAVDVHPPSAAMLALPGVACIASDVEAFAPRGVFDALLCDVNGAPETTAATVARLTAAVRTGGLIVLTIKLPRWDAYKSTRDTVAGVLRRAGIREVTVRHLWHNRQEVTFVGMKG